MHEMSDLESVITPSPNIKTIGELRSTYIARAKRNSSLSSSAASAPFGAPTKTIGTEWGVGVGLYFELTKWLRWLALLLMLCAIPFLVVIGCSVFTDAQHQHDHTFGVKRYSMYQVHSFTFAAIVDDFIDNGTLPYMNTRIGNTWNGPMRKSTFLIWISLVDAGAMLLFLLGLAVLWTHLKSFARATDEDTLEAADYTVMVRGLPPNSDPAQVGEHFSRFGEVMDVVLVTDRLSSTLRLCGRAASLQQRRTMILDASKVHPKVKYAVKMDRCDVGLASIAETIRELAEREQKVKAAFVTFNSESERRACVSQCPNNWLGARFQRRPDRFLREHPFWVRRAAAPDDYQYEDLAFSEWQLFAREIAINAVTLLLILVCAAAITKLTDISNQEGANLSWHQDRLAADAAAAIVFYSNPNTSTTFLVTPQTAADDAAAFLQGDVFGGELYPQLEAFCTRQLADSCETRLVSGYNNLVHVQYGSGLTWVNATSRLLFERAVQLELECSTRTTWRGPGCNLQGCLPCLCLGVARSGPLNTRTSGMNPRDSDTEAVCSLYLNELDVKSWGIRLSISAVVAVLNSFIKWVLGVLVLYGRHWTHTARETSYALQCFVAMWFNTVVVLLITNCEPLAQAARDSRNGNWTRFFVRYGAYNDFTYAWYENVGLSILILMIINIGAPLLNLAVDHLLLLGHRCCVLYYLAWPLQADYDSAWARPRFTLAQRTADLLLNVSLALLFGSGMPLLYLVLVVYLVMSELADRWALTRLCGGAPRYNTGVMKLVMGIMPWLAAAHCAFGLWMHTYFRVALPSDSSARGGIEEVSQLSAAVTSSRLSTSAVNLSVLQHSSVWRRITQPNGLALLLLLCGLVLWLLLGRYVLWKVVKFLGRMYTRLCGSGGSNSPCSWSDCCGYCSRLLIRSPLYRQSSKVVNVVLYGDALVKRQLHGTPTYRLVNHPHYLQYFAASGLNRAMGVAALVMSAANGGARRRTVYTRLSSVHRRGRLPSSASTFHVLPAPIMDPEGLMATDAAFAAVLNHDPRAAHQDDAHSTASDPADADGSAPHTPAILLHPMLPLSRLSRLGIKPSLNSFTRSPGGGAGGGANGNTPRSPDATELLIREEQLLARRVSTLSLMLGPGQLPQREEGLWVVTSNTGASFSGASPRLSGASIATAAAVVSLVPMLAPPLQVFSGGETHRTGSATSARSVSASASRAVGGLSPDGGLSPRNTAVEEPIGLMKGQLHAALSTLCSGNGSPEGSPRVDSGAVYAPLSQTHRVQQEHLGGAALVEGSSVAGSPVTFSHPQQQEKDREEKEEGPPSSRPESPTLKLSQSGSAGSV